MGKVRKLRQKYNASLANQKNSKIVARGNGVNDKIDGFLNKVQGTDQKILSINKISKIISKKGNLKKTDKRQQRRKLLLKKIDILSEEKRETLEKKKREKTVISGDMRPLIDALPSLDDVLAESKRMKKDRYDVNGKRLKNKEIKAMQRCEDVKTFQHVLNHSSYHKNPFETIKAYLSNRIREELS